jgi:hypothetical protein
VKLTAPEPGYRLRVGEWRVRSMFTAIRLRLRDANAVPTFFIDPSCTHLISAMKSYKPSHDGEAPAKRQDDHPIDALRYLLTAGPPATSTGAVISLSIDEYRRASRWS